MTELTLNDKFKAQCFHSINCFTDDLCAISREFREFECSEFGVSYTGIYPKELALKIKYKGFCTSFLNLDINKVDGKVINQIYDERDSSPFCTVRMPHIDSNIPNNILNSALSVDQTQSIARLTLHLSDFLPEVCTLVSGILRQVGKVQKCHSPLKKILIKN